MLLVRRLVLQLYYKVRKLMVKKLRNREIEQDTDEDYSSQLPLQQPALAMGPNKLRRVIQNKYGKNKQLQLQKQKKFKARMSDSEFGGLINESYFECSICLQIMVSPTMMLCGHTYCLKCLQSSFVYNHKCCLCRNEQINEPFIHNSIASKIIEKSILPHYPHYLNYLCRSTDSEEWLKRRTLTSLKNNLVIDFQDSTSTWRKGVVSSLFTQSDKVMAKIKIKINDYDLYDVVQASSRRIAPFTFFTRRRYLQQFWPSLPQSDRVDRQLFQLQYKPLVHQDEIWMQQNGEVSESIIREQQTDQAMRLFHFQMSMSQNILL